MWRGAAIDQFARLEATALRSLTELGAAGISKNKAADFVAWHRFARLRTILADARCAPVNRGPMALLDLLESEHDLRTALAHGRMKATANGIALTWHAAEKGDWNQKTQHLTWIQALAALRRLDKLQRDLASQLGQVKRHCLGASVSSP
jgi:hypothetical protein